MISSSSAGNEQVDDGIMDAIEHPNNLLNGLTDRDVIEMEGSKRILYLNCRVKNPKLT